MSGIGDFNPFTGGLNLGGDFGTNPSDILHQTLDPLHLLGPNNAFSENFGQDDPSTTASDTLAGLRRDQWNDYLAMFDRPERELVASYNNGAQRQTAINSAIGDVTRGAGLADASFQRRMATSGITLAPEQQAAYTRQRNLATGLNTVEAANRTTGLLADRDRALLLGGLRPVATNPIQAR